MTWDTALSALQSAVLSTFGVDGTYHSATAGVVTLDQEAGTGVVIDRDVEVMDEGGGYARQAIATIRSGLVEPRARDWIEVGAESWEVERVISDDGWLMQLAVRPRP